MSRKRRHIQENKNQLMLFSEAEMSGNDIEDLQVNHHEDNINAKGAIHTPVAVDDSERKEPSTASAGYNCPHTPEELADLVGSLSDNDASLVAMQSALLLQKELSPYEMYAIPSLPGMTFDLASVKRIAYLSVSRSFPNMVGSIGFDIEV